MPAKAKIDQFTDQEFTEIVATHDNMAAIAKALGYTSVSGSNGVRIRKRIDELQLTTDHFAQGNKRWRERTDTEVFVNNSTVSQRALRGHYEKLNIPYECSICGQKPIWNNKPLIMILDHINGHNHDNRLENLRWVCPNCNYQLPTTGSKNWVYQTKNE